MPGSGSERRGVEWLTRAAEVDELDLTIFMPCRDERGNVSRSVAEVVETLKPYGDEYGHGRYVQFIGTVGFDADMVSRMLDEGASDIEVPTVCHDRELGKSRALRIRNLISLAISFSDMLLRPSSKDRVPPRRLLPKGKPMAGPRRQDAHIA
jgi:hypothetical protein